MASKGRSVEASIEEERGATYENLDESGKSSSGRSKG
jgi:hypothetical protein